VIQLPFFSIPVTKLVQDEEEGTDSLMLTAKKGKQKQGARQV
jgi:hypothetical protein